MKIAIMGYSGAGKTYLANILSEKYNIPVMHLDAIKYDKAWKPIDDCIVLPQVSEFMKVQNWIIDGNYEYLLQKERLEAADVIIFVLLPRMQCLFRTVKRSRSRKREGYINDLNPRFIRFVLFECRSKKRRRSYNEIIDLYKHKTIVLKSQRQIDSFLKQTIE